jgi:hypothetical protein
VQLETDLTQSDIKEQLIRPASDATQRGVHGEAEATKASRSSATVRRRSLEPPRRPTAATRTLPLPLSSVERAVMFDFPNLQAAGRSDELSDRTNGRGDEERADNDGADYRSEELLSGSEIDGHCGSP